VNYEFKKRLKKQRDDMKHILENLLIHDFQRILSKKEKKEEMRSERKRDKKGDEEEKISIIYCKKI